MNVHLYSVNDRYWHTPGGGEVQNVTRGWSTRILWYQRLKNR
jgi:hypothetical protein